MTFLNFWKRNRMPEAVTWEAINSTGNSLLSPAYKSGTRVFTSGQTSGASEDVAEQTEQCALNMKKVLEAAGTSSDQVLKVLLFIKRAEDAPVVNAVYTKHFGTAPSRSCVVVDFPNPKILVEFELIATTDKLEKVTWESIGAPHRDLLSPAFKSNGIVHTSGQVGSDSGDDIETQAINAFENVKKVLEASGSSIDRSLKVLLFLKNASDAPIVNGIYEKYFKSKPSRSCIIVNFANPKILVELEVIAEYGEETAKALTWEKLGKSGTRFLSPAWISNGIVFTSGQVGVDSTGAFAKSAALQTELAIKRAIDVLEAAGTSIDKVLKVLLFVKNREDVAAVNEVYGKYFTNKPGRSAILVGFGNPELLVEMELIAEAGVVPTKL